MAGTAHKPNRFVITPDLEHSSALQTSDDVALCLSKKTPHEQTLGGQTGSKKFGGGCHAAGQVWFDGCPVSVWPVERQDEKKR
jgi:hypothetical protein